MKPMTIYPYLKPGTKTWVFDDERTGLKEEAFVLGMSEMITRLLSDKALPDPEKGFALTFSAKPFTDRPFDVELCWLTEANGGNWYYGLVADRLMSGWLCPALLHYFDKAPPLIYVNALPLPAGVNPIWEDSGAGKKFMSAP